MGFVKGVPNDAYRGVYCCVSYGRFFVSYFCVQGVCGVLFPYFWLSVPVQLIAWKDSSLK